MKQKKPNLLKESERLMYIISHENDEIMNSRTFLFYWEWYNDGKPKNEGSRYIDMTIRELNYLSSFFQEIDDEVTDLWHDFKDEDGEKEFYKFMRGFNKVLDKIRKLDRRYKRLFSKELKSLLRK